MTGFSHEKYDRLVQETVDNIRKLSSLKGGEYAGDVDRLANFRRNALALDLNMETVWAVYAAKHWDAIQQYIKDLQQGKTRTRLESITGRADDLIVYMILFKAMVEEREGQSSTQPQPQASLFPPKPDRYSADQRKLAEDRMELYLKDMEIKEEPKVRSERLKRTMEEARKETQGDIE